MRRGTPLIPSPSIVPAAGFAAVIAVLLAATIAPAQAQSPDFTNVPDFLNGQRTLLSVEDLVVGGLLFKTNSGTQIPPSNISTLPGIYSPTTSNVPEIPARMFNLPYDTIVYATNFDTVHALDPNSKTDKSVKSSETFITAFGKGDFEGTGYDDVVLAGTQKLQIVKAVDPTDFSKGIIAGPPLNIDSPDGLSYPVIAVGDFDGDGRPEFAIAYVKDNGSSPVTISFTVAIYKVDAKTLAITPRGSVDLWSGIPQSAGYRYKGDIAAGRFGNTQRDQLVSAFYIDSTGVEGAKLVQSFDFDSALNLIQKDSVYVQLTGTSLPDRFTDLVLARGHFDPQSPYDQVAMKYDKHLGILTFDSNLKIHLPTFTDPGGYECNVGMAVGSFARTQPNPQDPTKPQPSLESQIAITSATGAPACNGSLGVHIFNVNPPAGPGQDFVIDPNQAFYAELTNPSDAQFYGYSVIAADTQGRSLVLGDPTKITLTGSLQPTTIVALPPMHIDFLSPDPQSGAPQKLLNISAVPDSFFTKYSTQDTSKNGSVDTHDTGWSFSGKESIGGSIEFGSVNAGEGTKFSDTFTATQQLNHTFGNTHGHYSNYTYGVVQQTGYDDQVWYSQTRFNIWVYPVIGQTVCLANNTNCAPSEQKQLNVQFSGPDQISNYSRSGNLLPWYQPPWEPFNVLSYPASYSQLQKIVPDIAKLSEDTHFYTDASSLVVSSTWETGTNDEKSVGYDQTYTEDNDLSAVAAGDAGLFSVGLSADLDFGGSNSFHDLSQGTTALSKSTGIEIHKPGTVADPFLYGYDVTPYIFGQLKPGGFVNGQPLSTDISTFGMLRTAFVVDPTGSQAGGWWIKAYGQKPDVALNHPLRWSLSQLPQVTPLPDGCLAVGNGEMDCAVRSPATPSDPWNSELHSMRGFFISNAKTPGQGPLMETAIAGTTLALQARIYNYSLKAMSSDTAVHVRFYAQPWDVANQVPLKGKSSLLVGEDKLGPIPPFDSTDGAPLNWVLANATFDTTGYDSQYFTFWVVAWMEDRDGKMIPDIQGHGLTAIPGTLTSLADISRDEEQYDNNVGFFRLAFYVRPKSTGLESSPIATSEAVDIGQVQLSSGNLALGQSINISTLLSAGDSGVAGPTAVFYDGDPHAGGTVFGLDHASYIRPNDGYKVTTKFKATSCGVHDIFVVINQNSSNEVVRRAPPVTVSCAETPTIH